MNSSTGMRCPISQEQCHQLLAFLNSQSNGNSQINPNGVHQVFALMASGVQSQAVHQSLIPKFSSNFVISSITPQSRNSDIDLTHLIFFFKDSK